MTDRVHAATIEAGVYALVGVERVNVARRQLPEHAVHLMPRMPDDRRIAVRHDDETMVIEHRGPERTRVRTMPPHQRARHVGPVRKMQRHQRSLACSARSWSTI